MKKTIAIPIIAVFSLIAIVGAIYGISAENKAIDYERYISANYRHAFSELADGISDLDSALQKSLLVTTPSLAGTVCTEVYGKAQTAGMALGVLPLSSTQLEKTAGFINRVGDYSFALLQKASAGQSFTEEERANLRSLSETATLLSQNLKAMQNDIGSGLITLGEYEGKMKKLDDSEGEIVPQTLGDSMGKAEEEFPEMPTLIYDGPFSEHLRCQKPIFVEGMEEMDASTGRQAAAKFLGIRPESVFPSGELRGDIPSLCYGAQLDKSEVSICLTRQGGVVYQFISSRVPTQSTLSVEDGMKAAKRFLEMHGYKDMKESYYLISDNVMTVNFAYVQDGVVCYPDLIKVGIAMNDGSLISFEAHGYVCAHKQRELPPAAISPEQARAKVPQDINILDTKLVLIPDSGKNEVLCHEFQCEDAKGQQYIVYVNALTGEQEQILIILQDENGTLTI